MRDLDPVLLEILQSRSFIFLHLLTMELSNGNLYLTDDENADVQHEGTTYVGGKLNKVDSVSYSTRLSTNDTTFKFNDADKTMLALLLQGNWQGKKVTVERLYISSDGAKKSKILLWRGSLDSMNTKKSVLSITAASVWAQFDAVRGRKTNSASQQVYYPNDKGFDETPLIVKDTPWGKANPVNVNNKGR